LELKKQKNKRSKEKRQKRDLCHRRNKMDLQEWGKLLKQDLSMFASQTIEVSGASRPATFLVAPYPEGMRLQVRSGESLTIARNMQGKSVLKFKSFLPGGGLIDHTNKVWETKCLLDCVLNKSLNTLFVIDLLKWGEESYVDKPFIFRLQQLHLKLKDVIVKTA